MVPILFPGTAKTFTTNGVGRLSEAIRCIVTEERNGEYECEFDYPITGKFYIQMLSMVEAYARGVRSQMGIIACIHDDLHDIQPFDLYAVSAPMNGIVTFNAHHVSYRLNDEIVEPFDASSIAQCIGALPGKVKGGSEFTYWTDKTATGNFAIEIPQNVRSLLGGSQGSFLDIYGSGEYQFDKFNVKLYANRGIDSNITIRYGKNLLDVTRELDSSDTYNAVAPYWQGQLTYEDGSSEDITVILDELVVKDNTYNGSVTKARPLDLSTAFDEEPTAAQLRSRAQTYLSDNEPWTPNDNVKVSFVQLWQTTEYENVAALQRLSLCDTVNVYYPELGIITTRQEVIKVVYNVLLERYDEMELGTAESSFADTISKSLMADFYSDLEKAKRDAVNDSMLQAAIQHATDLITGGLGGHVVFTLNANGEPEEILIMDTADVSTARNVWRFNQGGLGHSHTGYNGPFSDVALTMDGCINATMITAGTLNANLIKAGIIQDTQQRNYWNMATGEFQLQGYATSTDVSNASSSTLSSAKQYADGKDSTHLATAKTYAENQANGALSSAKTYAEGQASSALYSAKSYADTKITDYDENLNQAKVFNKLTSNGTLKGIYMKDNKLYINASYIYGGTLKLGGLNNENGLLTIHNSAGALIGQIDNTGALLRGDITLQKYITSGTTGASYKYNGRSEIIAGYFTIPSDIATNVFGTSGTVHNYGLVGRTADCYYNEQIMLVPTMNHAYSYGLNGDNIGSSSAIFSTGDLSIASNCSTTRNVSNIGRSYIRLRNGTIRLYNGVKYAMQILSDRIAFYSDDAPYSNCYFSDGGNGYLNFTCNGTKSRYVATEDFGDRLLYCYETPSPMFGDVGEAVIDEDGKSYVFIDPVFSETVSTNIQYQVFLQKYGSGECFVSERRAEYFIVEGTPGMHFGWEIKARQSEFDQLRLESTAMPYEVNTEDYGELAKNYIDSLYDERMSA